jgi:anaerobic ribonucleoside-triphosphate reductase
VVNSKLKTEIEQYLNNIESYEQIDSFQKFIINLKEDNFLDKDSLYNTLLSITETINQDSIQYVILTDTMDYFVGYHPPLLEGSSQYYFVKRLNNSNRKI